MRPRTPAPPSSSPARWAPGIETDVRLSSDGILVLVHDDRIDRTTDGSGAVADFSWAELVALDAGSWLDGRWAGERIVRLDWLLDWAFPVHQVPFGLTLRLYAWVVNSSPFPRFFLNSVVVAVATTLGQLVSSALAAFAFARLRFWGQDVLFLLFLGTLMVPEPVTYVPLFMVAKYLELVGSYAGLIGPAIVTPFGIFLLRQAFLGIPSELEDAARIDGGGLA
jgi:ABC-type glycerol-3-phosphate transport system permease component